MMKTKVTPSIYQNEELFMNMMIELRKMGKSELFIFIFNEFDIIYLL